MLWFPIEKGCWTARRSGENILKTVFSVSFFFRWVKCFFAAAPVQGSTLASYSGTVSQNWEHIDCPPHTTPLKKKSQYFPFNKTDSRGDSLSCYQAQLCFQVNTNPQHASKLKMRAIEACVYHIQCLSR